MNDHRKGGLRRKYNITKADGRPCDPEAVYFVLRLDGDPHARKAALAYAESVEGENRQFAEDIRGSVKKCEPAGD